jgi:hypothetical protein
LNKDIASGFIIEASHRWRQIIEAVAVEDGMGLVLLKVMS